MISLKNFYKQTSPKVKKFGLWVKGLIGTAAATTFIQNDVKTSFYLMIAGAVITGLLECLPPDKPGDNSGNGSATGGVAMAMLAGLLMLAFAGCTVVKPEVDRTKTDTTVTSYSQVDLFVKGAKVVAGINMDSLYHAALMARDQRKDDSLAQLKMELKYKQDSIAALQANKPLPPKPVFIPSPPQIRYKTDPDTKAQLSYWIDQYGQLNLGCESKDKTIQTLQAQVTKLTKDTTVTTKVVTQTPAWNKLIMILEGAIIGILIVVLIIKTI